MLSAAIAWVYPRHPVWQRVPAQAHRVGQGHGLGTWWEPAAALTCTSLFTAFGVLQNLGDIFKISEIEEQKLPKGLLPGPGTLSCSSLFFLVGLLPPTSTRPATPARRTTPPPASAG
jgi:hypothetical protein